MYVAIVCLLSMRRTLISLFPRPKAVKYVYTFLKRTISLRVQGSVAVAPKRSNCTHRGEAITLSMIQSEDVEISNV